MLKSETRKIYLLNKYLVVVTSRSKRPREIKKQTIIKRTDSCPFYLKNIDKKNTINKIEKNKKRTKTVNKIKNIYYILCFKNKVLKTGASIIHTHSQIFTANILPPDIHKKLGLTQLYKIKHTIYFYYNIIKKEIKNKRKIYKDNFITSFVYYASKYYYKVLIFIKRNFNNITKVNNNEFKLLAHILKKTLIKLKKLNLSFNFFLHQIISNKNQYFYLKIQLYNSLLAYVEFISDIVINFIIPEEVTKYYRL